MDKETRDDILIMDCDEHWTVQVLLEILSKGIIFLILEMPIRRCQGEHPRMLAKFIFIAVLSGV